MTGEPIPADLPLRRIHRLLREGALRPSQLVEAAVERHRRRGGHDAAYLTWTGGRAAAFAAPLDRLLALGAEAGPLMGVPVSIKDIFGVPGLPTYAGSPRRLPERWERAGPLVAALLRQLPPLMGKTHTVEFAFGGLGTNAHWGTPRNPWDLERHRAPGGSSAGAGVTVATGTAWLALGSDTAGSVRIPAAMTGIAGLKTTGGRWPTDGIVPLSSTLDTPGLLARSVDDLAFAFAALDADIRGVRDPVPSPPELSGLTFGVPRAFFWDACSPGVAEAVEEAIAALERRGARRIDLDLPRCGEAYDLFRAGGVAAIELAAFLHAELPDWIATLERNVADRVAAADSVASWEYVRRRGLLADLAREAAAAMAGVDAVLAPTVAITPPALDDLAPEGEYARHNVLALRNTVIANFMGLCALTTPAGRDGAGMPVGLQIMAAPGRDARLLAIGLSVEAALGQGRDILGAPPDPPAR
jgi:aspartyl-tRNA(Asn)/glutamyl-tRNA(Gln) amidotransferase subunit A